MENHSLSSALSFDSGLTFSKTTRWNIAGRLQPSAPFPCIKVKRYLLTSISTCPRAGFCAQGMQDTPTPDTRQAQAEAGWATSSSRGMQNQQLGWGEEAEEKPSTEQRPADQPSRERAKDSLLGCTRLEPAGKLMTDSPLSVSPRLL